MSDSDTVTRLLASWQTKAEELETVHERLAGDRGGSRGGGVAVAFEQDEPLVKKDAVEECIADLEDASGLEEVFETLAEWTKEAERLDTRTEDSDETARRTMRRFQLEECIDELAAVVPDDDFETCSSCQTPKEPIRDKRYRVGFRWECPTCSD